RNLSHAYGLSHRVCERSFPTRRSSDLDGKQGTVSGHKVKAVDATGAGDAFWGGFLSKLLMNGVEKTEDLTEDIIRSALEYGNARSEEHTSELQSRFDLVCRLLLEKKKH